MRCFDCNTPCRGTFCGPCAEKRSAQRRSDSIWSPKVAKVKHDTNAAPVRNGTFASKLTIALSK